MTRFHTLFTHMISRWTCEQMTEYIYNLITCHISLRTLISITISEVFRDSGHSLTWLLIKHVPSDCIYVNISDILIVLTFQMLYMYIDIKPPLQYKSFLTPLNAKMISTSSPN